jgi:hypothetical protein
MRTTPHAHSLTRALCLAALAAACGSGDGPTEPGPATTTTLTVNFASILAVRDCDGVEGEGDFEFEVRFGRPPAASGEVVYSRTINLDAGATTADLGTRSLTVEATDGVTAQVSFTATELDLSIVGQEYPDERLDAAFGSMQHVFSNGTWSNLGPQSISLGSGECRVRLDWTAG